MQNPKVSIVIPVYNGSNYLDYAINCALNQTYKNIEIIVVNDGSMDNGKTEEIALSYGSRIRYFNKTNGGVSSALNYGISKMTGDYFSWLSHDDAYTPEKIEKSIDLLKYHNMFGKKCIAYIDGYFIDSNGDKIKNFKNYFSIGKVYSGLEVLNKMIQKGTLFGCCMLIPKTTFDEVGYFDESLRYSQDSLMWYKMFLSGYSLIFDSSRSVMCRLHKEQVSHLRRDLFEHDALVIAKMLAEPLAKIESNGVMLKKYIKRLTKYQCNDTIFYLYQYADENGYLGKSDRFSLSVYKLIGLFRFRMVTALKNTLMKFRQ